MANPTINIARGSLHAPASQALIAELNRELLGAYPDPGATHFALDAGEVSEGRGAFLVVTQGGATIGCGAVRMIDPRTAELKRMFIAPAARGRGIGRRLVDALEAEARALGARRLVLETGVHQHAAIALYRRVGFEPIELYGEYCLSPDTSLCMGKALASDSVGA